jgi:hypothetical protein
MSDRGGKFNMLSLPAEKNRLVTLSVWMQEFLFVAAGLWFLMSRVHPTLILESQTPVFLSDHNFYYSYLILPGGLTDWLAAFIMQFWFSNFWTSLFLILCFWCIAWMTRRWIETLVGHCGVHTIHLIPAGMLLILTAQYDFHFSIVLALMINLCFLNMFLHWAPDHKAFRAAVGITVSLFLFWFTGGAFFIFSLLCGLNEVFLRKKYLSGVSMLFVSCVLPYIAAVTIFLVIPKQAYLHNLIENNQIPLWYVGYALPLFYLIAVFLVTLSKVSIVQNMISKFIEISRWKSLSPLWKNTIGILVFFGSIIVIVQETANKNARLVLEINQSIKNNHWQQVQQTAMQCTIVNPLISSQTNLALFQSGRLLEHAFVFPQFYGTGGIIMDYDWSLKFPDAASNVYWRLGLVNESLHWAHEALELKGPTPEILKQLGLVYMIKGDQEAAKKFFLNLGNVPNHQDEAKNLIRMNESPAEFAQDSMCRYIQSCIPNSNLMTIVKSPSEELELLLKRNPNNKMAFEYLITYYLMSGNIQGFLNHFADGRVFNYPRVPRHMQEAFLVAASMGTKFDQNQLQAIVGPNTFQRFEAYQRILQNYQGNISSAKPELQKLFGDTYWFYLMYVRSEVLQLEKQYEFQ